MRAELILENANVVTMDAALPAARAVAVKDGRILAVGSPDEMETVTGPGTQTIDCEGRTLAPGFNDAHCHIFSFVRNQLSLDLAPPGVRSIDDIKALIRRKVADTPPGRWISGAGYSDFHLAEKRHPTRADIDEVAPRHPVVLSHRSLHACVLNSLALELAGITTETPEPPGARIERDPATGEPNGILFEMLGHIRYGVMPPLSGDELHRAIALAGRQFLSLGITSLQDATVTNEVKRWHIYREAQERGTLRSRIYLMTGIDRIKGFHEAGLTFRAGNDYLRMGGLKIVLGEATGRLHPSQADLDRYVLEANRAGYQVAIHAVQPATVEAAVAALEYAHGAVPRQDLRHRLEHCAECPPRLFDRVLKLKAVVSMQPPFLYYSGERYLARMKPEEVRWLYRVRSFLEAGSVVCGSSDTPVVPNDPLVGMYAAVTRRTAAGQVIVPEERISPRQALALYTSAAAFASFDDAVKGTITPGKLADLVLLSDDPAAVEAEAISEIRVLMTMVGGKVVWEA